MASVAADSEHGELNPYTTQLTKAMPKVSLFGTALEKADHNKASNVDVKAYEAAELKIRAERASRYQHKVPEYLHDMNAKKNLEEDKFALSQKERELSYRQNAIADMENRAKFFQSVPPDLNVAYQTKKKILLAHPGLDLQLSQKMNDIGYASKHDYNRDRNQAKPPAHKYLMIGDPLQYGMDFSLNRSETHEQFQTPQIVYTKKTVEDVLHQKSPPVTFDELHRIPKNIRALYRSDVFDQLFSDKSAIERIEKQLVYEKLQKQRKREKIDLPPVQTFTPKNYGDLSHSLRINKFDGYTFHEPTLMKESHSQQVFDRRYKDPDEFRHKWDEYGKWKEKELMRDQLCKDLDQQAESNGRQPVNLGKHLVKFEAKKQKKALSAEKTVRNISEPRKKKASKKPAKKKALKQPAFEDVHFVSPPKSPEQEHSKIVPVSNFKRDDDFWNFYDQGLPPVGK